VLTIAIAAGIKGDELDPYSLTAAVLFFGSAVLFYIAAATVKPVRLSGLHKNLLIISIRNEAFFREFRSTNAEAISGAGVA
jgi:hypothetical protein